MLAGTVGLGALGWLVGTACGVVTAAGLLHGLSRSGSGALGAANRVTLTRATLVGGVTALVADALVGPASVAATVGLAVVALVLDGVDGWVARRTGTVSALGARFDMEVDAFLILVLSVYVAAIGRPVGAGHRRGPVRRVGGRLGGAVAAHARAAALLAQARGGDPGHRADGGRGRPCCRASPSTWRSPWRWSCSPSPSAGIVVWQWRQHRVPRPDGADGRSP